MVLALRPQLLWSNTEPWSVLPRAFVQFLACNIVTHRSLYSYHLIGLGDLRAFARYGGAWGWWPNGDWRTSAYCGSFLFPCALGNAICQIHIKHHIWWNHSRTLQFIPWYWAAVHRNTTYYNPHSALLWMLVVDRVCGARKMTKAPSTKIQYFNSFKSRVLRMLLCILWFTGSPSLVRSIWKWFRILRTVCVLQNTICWPVQLLQSCRQPHVYKQAAQRRSPCFDTSDFQHSNKVLLVTIHASFLSHYSPNTCTFEK